MSNPRQTVSPPAANVPPKFGLLDAAAAFVGATDEHWLNGVKYQPLACGGGEVFPFGTTGATTGTHASGVASWAGGSSPFTGETNAKGLDDRPDIVKVDPFLVIAGDTCSTLDKDNPDGDYIDRAMATLALNEGRLVEQELMFAAAREAAKTAGATELTGQGLNNLAATVGPGAAVSLKYGLGLLAEYASARGVGMPWYHLPRRAIHMTGTSLVAKFDGDAGVARAYDEGLLIFGAGYDNHDGAGDGAHPGPGTVVPGAHQAWVYVTSPIRIWRTEPSVLPEKSSQALTRDGSNGITNSYEYRVERGYLVDWDRCATAAVLVDLSL